MVKFGICTKVEPYGAHRYLARAVAIPCDVVQRCAPEERSLICPSLEKARAAEAHLAHVLAEDIAARGNCVVREEHGSMEETASRGFAGDKS